MSPILWLIALVAFLALEAGTVNLVSIWFAAGSLAALIASWLGGQFWLQITLFLGLSVVLLLCLRPILRRYFVPRLVKTNAESVVGTVSVVTEAVDNLSQQGRLVINGIDWAARSSDGRPIPVGTKVRVDRIEGVRVFVTPVSEVCENV